MVNWRTLTNNTCDLGVSGTAFKDIYASGELKGVSAIRNSGSSVIYGNGASTVDIQNVVIGNNALVSAGNISNTIIGSASFATGGGACVAVGTAANCLLTGAVAIGESSFANGTNSIALGRLATTSAIRAISLGFNVGNSTADSLVVGSGAGSIVNMRPNTSGTCDLGTSTNQFKDVYSSGIVKTGTVDPIAASLLFIGNTNATGISIGKSTITTQVVGDFTTTQGYGSWYSTTNYAPPFTASTGRLTPPSVSASGPLSLFTQVTPGVLRYDGLVTRTFRVEYNLCVTASVGGSPTISFYNSKSGSTI